MALLRLSLLAYSQVTCLQWTCLQLWYTPHYCSVFENILFLCLCAFFVRQHCLKHWPCLLIFFRYLHYMRNNSVVLFPCCSPTVTGKGKGCSLYCMWAVKPLCKSLSGAELVSCIKHLMSVCGSMLKHFQPGCLKALRNTWAQVWCVCQQQALI